MNKFKQLIKATGIYFLGNVLAKIVSFLMLPLYTRYISTEGMGYYDLVNSYLNIIIPIVCVTIWAGTLRYILDYSETKDKNKVIYNSGIILACGIIVLTIGIFGLGQIGGYQYAELIFAVAIATALQNYYSGIARGLGYNAIFAISGIVGSFLNCLTNICLILGAKMGEDSLFISLAVGLIAQCVIMESKVKLRKKISTRWFDKALCGKLFKYSAPLAINSVCYWFLSSYNRIGISNVLGLEANGIYSIAGKYTYVISLLSNAISMAMQEFLYRTGSTSNDKTETYTLLSTNYMKMLLLGVCAILPVIQITFPLLIGEAYSDAYTLVPLYMLATVFSIYALFLGDIFSAEKQTRYIAVTTIPAALINISVFHVLVPHLKIQAANVALLCGFLALIIGRFILLRKIATIRIDFKALIGLMIVFIASYRVYLLNNYFGSAFMAGVCVLVFVYAFRDIIMKIFRK